MARFIAKLWMKLFIFLHFLYSTSQGESETTEQNDKMLKLNPSCNFKRQNGKPSQEKRYMVSISNFIQSSGKQCKRSMRGYDTTARLKFDFESHAQGQCWYTSSHIHGVPLGSIEKRTTPCCCCAATAAALTQHGGQWSFSRVIISC